MKAITIWQPYASLIICGLKRFETRSWSTKCRGPLIIHAAKKWDRERAGDVERVQELIKKYINLNHLDDDHLKMLIRPIGETLGCALGAVRLTDCQQMDSGRSLFENEVGSFGPGRYGWSCLSPVPFSEPILAKGMQGLWNPSDELVAKVKSELGV